MALTVLDAVNQMLGSLGELPVNDVEATHPMVPAAVSALNNASAAVQADAWWFCQEYVTLHPQADTKHLIVPNDTASADSLTEYPRLGVRGTRLYNMDEATSEFNGPLRVRLHRIVPFDDCPITARMHISAVARLRFQADFDADANKAQMIAGEVRATFAKLNAEHIRNERCNLFRRSGVSRIVASVGRAPYNGIGLRDRALGVV